MASHPLASRLPPFRVMAPPGADDGKQKIPTWDGDPKSWRTYQERALQYCESTKKQERYLCGPRLEVRLTGRAEAVVERCKVGWLSHDNGVEK